MRASHAAVLALLSTTWLAGCSREKAEAPAPAQPAVATADWQAFANAFIESRFKADPSFGVQSGRHEFDGQMPDWSRAALDADVAQLREQLAGSRSSTRRRSRRRRHSNAGTSSGSSTPSSSGV